MRIRKRLWALTCCMLMIFLLPFAVPIVKKWGKRKSIMVGLGASAISHILILFANDNLGLFMVGKVISGLAVIPYFMPATARASANR